MLRTSGSKCSGGFTSCKLLATCTITDSTSDVKEDLTLDFSGSSVSGTVDLHVTHKASGNVCDYHFDVNGKRN